MMSDSRAYDGWRRLSAAVMVEVHNDDPAGLRQVREQLDRVEGMYRQAVATMAGTYCPAGCKTHVHYSHGEIARELGVTRQAVSKLIKAATS